MKMLLLLPYPPSVNTYWRNWNGRMVLSAKGREYRNAVPVVKRGLGVERCRVTLDVRPPDRRRRDLDNVCKAVLDALGHANVYDDDSQIDELTVVRGELDRPDGCVFVTVEAI